MEIKDEDLKEAAEQADKPVCCCGVPDVDEDGNATCCGFLVPARHASRSA